ncbi:MAG: response regulator [Lachnospiraceae bacterium]|nr:response regulator [Lachnospiraceae bacterium]
MIHSICIIGMLIITCIIGLFIEDPKAIYLSFGTCVMFVLTMAEANRTQRFKQCVIFMSLFFNFVYMPEIYRLFNRNISVIPVYFLFGILYSIIMIDAKTAVILGSAETAFFTAFLVFMRNRMTTGLESPMRRDIVISYTAALIAEVAVGVCAGAAVRFRFMFHQKMQEEAEEKKVEAMDAYIAKDMFLINMSHEIRTPMNAIVGTVDLLLDQEVSEHVSDSVYNILNSCNALLSITDELMDLSRSENGSVELFASTYDLSDILNEVINMMTVRLTESNLSFYVDINRNIPRFLYGDSSKIRQLFVNILNNAVKFTRSGKIIMRVDYRFSSSDMIELIVDIEDTGIGIKKENIKDLFSKRSSDPDDEGLSPEGAGMGLSICAEILKEMNGEISVQSEYMSGSVFTFRVPQRFTSMDTVAYLPDPHLYKLLVYEKDSESLAHVRKILEALDVEADYARTKQDMERLINVNRYTHVLVANENSEEYDSIFRNRLIEEDIVVFLNIDDSVRIADATTILTRPIHILNIAALLKNETNTYVREISRKGGFECPRATILVVDDNYTNLNVARAILEKYGATVLTAMSGKDALRVLSDHEADLVFLDYMMPEMNGIDTLENIRKIPGSKYVSMPVVALTANVVSGAREMFLEAGFEDFLAKPISIDKMEKMLRKYLRRDLIVAKSHTDLL